MPLLSIPRLSRKTIDKLPKELRSVPIIKEDAYINELIRSVAEDNPVVAEAIRENIYSPVPTVKARAVGMLFMYLAIQKQIEEDLKQLMEI